MASTDKIGFPVVAGHGAHNGAVQVYGQLVRDCQHTNAVREERLQRDGDVLCKFNNIDIILLSCQPIAGRQNSDAVSTATELICTSPMICEDNCTISVCRPVMINICNSVAQYS
jgi:hypothetical protein